MRIVSWNINSLRKRQDRLFEWLDQTKPDVVCLQETKCPDEQFPALALRSAGYDSAYHGEKSYNGVAILSKRPLEDVSPRLPGGNGDDHSRYLEAVVSGDAGSVRVASIYAPNGNPIGTDKFAYKLGWMERLHAHTQALLRREIPFVLAGDYNVCPRDEDVYDPVAMRDDALVQPESRARFRALLYLGLTDTYRAFHRESHRYTFWDYQAGRWNRDEGLRIDHLLLSPHAADRVTACDIDKSPRGKDRASDHTPIWCELAL